MTEAPERILVVDDEENMVHFLTKLLRAEGFVVEGTGTGEAALDRLRDAPFELVLTDLKLPDTDGIEILKAARELHPETVVVLITAHGTIESAIEAMRAGAYDYVTKPFRASEILQVVNKALERVRLRREVVQLRQAVEQRFGLAGLVGKSAKMQEVYTQIEKFAAARGVVLIQGESGTGKELVAKALHFNSPRKAGPFVVIDCGAIPEALQESELFGHEKGAFTGAQYRRKGKIELAHGGTLFLDEIGDISPKMQIDLLRVIETKRFTRLGGDQEVTSDFRLVCATNKDLEKLVEEKAFREDLYYRINVFTIQLPPLRERTGDILPLARHFVQKYARAMAKPPMEFSPEAEAMLLAYRWPGNVRELENAVERAMVIGKGPAIQRADLPLALDGEVADPKDLSLEALEKEHIERVLAQHDGNVTQSAQVLGIDRATLYHKIKRYGLRR